MPWYRVDDEFDDDVDLERMTCEAITLNLCAGTWSSRKLTDGFISEDRVRKLKGGENGVPQCLLDGGVKAWWIKVDGGYQIRSFLKFNPSKAQVLARQAERSEAGRKGAESRWHDRENGNSHDSRHSSSDSNSHSSSNGSEDAPYPVSRIPNTHIPEETTARAGGRGSAGFFCPALTCPIPERIDSPAFRAQWELWLEFQAEHYGVKLSERSGLETLAFLVTNIRDPVNALKYSRAQRYKGIFDEGGGPSRKQKASSVERAKRRIPGAKE